jgi:hypothetical protein
MIRVRCLAVVGLCLVLGMALAVVLPAQPVLTARPSLSSQPVTAQEVSGMYAVQQSTTSGTETQVTLSVSLTSSADTTLQSTRVALRSALSGTTQEITASFSLPPQGNADFTATVTITQAEYKLWQQGARPVLVLELQSSDGTQITRTVALVPSVHAEAN